MSAVDSATERFLSGLPVPVDPGSIERRLSALWKPLEPGEAPPAQLGSRSVTRACLSSVIFYLPHLDARARVAPLIAEVGRRFPSRMILLCPGAWETENAAPNTPQGESTNRLRAFISASCSAPAAGGVPVCCEQITLECAGHDLGVFRGAVAPLLVPDVPVTLVVLSAADLEIYSLLADLLDRVVLDSRGHPVEALERGFRLLRAGRGCALDDLAWRELAQWRVAIGSIFEDPAALDLLGSARSLEIQHRPGGESRAALLAGWFCSRAGRRLPVVLREEGSSSGSSGELLAFSLEAGTGAGESHIQLRLERSQSLLRVESHTSTACSLPRAIPLRREETSALLGGALERTTNQHVLREALAMACRLELRNIAGDAGGGG